MFRVWRVCAQSRVWRRPVFVWRTYKSCLRCRLARAPFCAGDADLAKTDSPPLRNTSPRIKLSQFSSDPLHILSVGGTRVAENDAAVAGSVRAIPHRRRPPTSFHWQSQPSYRVNSLCLPALMTCWSRVVLFSLIQDLHVALRVTASDVEGVGWATRGGRWVLPSVPRRNAPREASPMALSCSTGPL